MYCWKCGEDNDNRFGFCTACGANLRDPLPGEASSAPEPPGDLSDEVANTVPVFASNIGYGESKGKLRLFILITGGGLLLLILTAVAATLVWRQISSSDETGGTAAGNSADGNNNSNSSDRASRPSKADEEFAQINTQLNGADLRERKSVIESAVKAAESRYPEDYRFAYQAAKLEAMTSKSHHEAFEMLFGVAKQAIETGKSAELLTALQQDGKNSLRRLTDHKEWKILETALRNNDLTELEVK